MSEVCTTDIFSIIQEELQASLFYNIVLAKDDEWIHLSCELLWKC